MKYAFRAWEEAMFHANSEAFKTGLRHRVSVSWRYREMSPLWRVEPITRPMMRVVDWPEKVFVAQEARRAAKKIREGKAISFTNAPGPRKEKVVDFAIH